jgi:hypothetical protein
LKDSSAIKVCLGRMAEGKAGKGKEATVMADCGIKGAMGSNIAEEWFLLNNVGLNSFKF